MKLLLTALIVIIFSTVSSASILLDRVVAVVNEEVITWSELYRTMETNAPSHVKKLNEDGRRKALKEKEADYLETLINIKLQLQEARGMGISVTDKELNEAIENIKKKYSMTDASFKESLKGEGYTYASYRKRLKEQIITGKIISKQVRSKILVSDEDAKKYMKENKDTIETSNSYRISQIFFKKPNNEEDKKTIEGKAAFVHEKLTDGESFSVLAEQYSEDSSVNTGGDLGFIKKKHLNKEFIEVVSKMNIGEVSDPFWTQKGLHIIRLDEKKGPKDQDDVIEEVRTMLSNKIFKEKYNAWIKGLREKSFIETRL